MTAIRELLDRVVGNRCRPTCWNAWKRWNRSWGKPVPMTRFLSRDTKSAGERTT